MRRDKRGASDERRATARRALAWALAIGLGGAPAQASQEPHAGDPPRPVVQIPASIDATGAADVTRQLQAFLDSIPDSTTVEFPAGARYRVEGGLTFMNRRGLTFEGNGATTLATTDGRGVRAPAKWRRHWPRNRRHWLFVSGGDITLRNLVVKGANRAAGVGDKAYVKALEAQHGLEFLGVDGVKVDRVTVTDVHGDFVYLGGSGGTWTRDVHIHDSHFERNGRQGIAITAAADVLIERNYIGQTRRSSIDLEPNNVRGGARRIVIRENTFGRGRLKFLASAGKGSQVQDITIEGNGLQGRSLDMVVGASDRSRRAGFRILNNISDNTFGSPLALMRFSRIDGIEVRGNVNRLAPRRSMTGVTATNSCDVNVADNRFEGAAREAEIVPYPCPER